MDKMCDKCSKTMGVLVLLSGVLFLLKDLGYWGFWGVNWWTVLLLIAGVGTLAKGGCNACCNLNAMQTGKKK